jgi:DnaJ-class molecular chaperone
VTAPLYLSATTRRRMLAEDRRTGAGLCERCLGIGFVDDDGWPVECSRCQGKGMEPHDEG